MATLSNPPDAAPTPRAYADLKALCEAELGPFDVLYVTPRIEDGGANPYLRLLYRPFEDERPSRLRPLRSTELLRPFLRRILRGERAAWHQHWLQFSSFPTFVRTNFRLLGSILFAAAGGRILWTLHNERPHGDRFVGLNQWYARRLARHVHRFHVHHAEGAKAAERLFGAGPDRVALLPHPDYEVRKVPKAEALAALAERYGVEARGRAVLLMFGAIARYKGIDEVAEAVAALDPEKVLLVVAGGVRSNETDYGTSLRVLTGPAVAILDRHIPEEDVGVFFGAADWAVFNHRRSLTSGAMTLATNYGCSIIAPDLEASAALAGPGVRKFRGPEDLAALLKAAAEGRL